MVNCDASQLLVMAHTCCFSYCLYWKLIKAHSGGDLSKNKALGALSAWAVLSVSSYHLPTTHAQFIGKACLHGLQNLSRGTERGRSRRWTAAWVPDAQLVPDRSPFLKSRCVLVRGYCGRLNHRTQFFTSLRWYYTLTLLQGLLRGDCTSLALHTGLGCVTYFGQWNVSRCDAGGGLISLDGPCISASAMKITCLDRLWFQND